MIVVNIHGIALYQLISWVWIDLTFGLDQDWSPSFREVCGHALHPVMKRKGCLQLFTISRQH